MKQPHKYAALIKAWADGAEIETYDTVGERWYSIDSPSWNSEFQYRIKPEPKPDVVRYAQATMTHITVCDITGGCAQDNIKLTFDGETLKLKAVEMINGGGE